MKGYLKRGIIKLVMLVVLLGAILALPSSAEESGCCINPLRPYLACRLDPVSLSQCCPSDLGDYDKCVNEYFKEGISCTDVVECKIKGCCCSKNGGTIDPNNPDPLPVFESECRADFLVFTPKILIPNQNCVEYCGEPRIEYGEPGKPSEPIPPEERQCTPGTTQSCPKQAGVCGASYQVCNEEGFWPGCLPTSYGPYYVDIETSEHCDGLDNDCDSLVDEECPEELVPFVPGCTYNEELIPGNMCVSDIIGSNDPYASFSCQCVDADRDNDGYNAKEFNGNDCDDNPETGASINPGREEICGNEVDENCDGNVNENCGRFCDKDGDGHIAEGIFFCSLFAFGNPVDDCDDFDWKVHTGVEEVCDKPYYKNNNCDDKTDAEHFSSVEEACDGIDNNCNGAVDEGCSCTFTSNPPNYKRIKALCRDGFQVCNAQGEWVTIVEPIFDACPVVYIINEQDAISVPPYVHVTQNGGFKVKVTFTCEKDGGCGEVFAELI